MSAKRRGMSLVAHVSKDKPTEEEAQDAMERLIILKAEEGRLKKTIRTYVRSAGRVDLLDANGKIIMVACNKQSMRNVPNPQAVVNALKQMDDAADSCWKWLFLAMEKISITGISGFVKHLNSLTDGWVYSQMEFDDDDEGGFVTVYGAASIDITKTPPKEGETHVIEPGDEPLGFNNKPKE